MTDNENKNIEEETQPQQEEKQEVKDDTASTEETKEEKPNKELSEIKDKYLRICAEYDNYRKRSEKEKTDSYTSGMTFAVKMLLPVLDNLERALAFDKENEGFKMITKQILDSFSKIGITEIESDGKEFDPELHNAIMHEEDEAQPEKMVVQTFQKGYMLNGKVVRHAMVKVVN